MNVFTKRLRNASAYIEEYGWVQGLEQNWDGKVCLTGAIRLCAPQTGDEQIIREVLYKLGRAELWNDFRGRTKDDVLHYLSTAQITNKDLEMTFGPQWRYMVTFVRQAASMSRSQAKALEKSWLANSESSVVSAARIDVQRAVRDSDLAPIWDRVLNVLLDIARAEALPTDLFRSPLKALITRDRIRKEHFDALYKPWRAVFGDPKPCED